MQSLPLRLLDDWLAPPPDARRIGWLARQDFAHRGLHGPGIPENSLAGFAAAVARGLGIECDIRKSREGRAIVFHDETLDRLTAESGPLSARSVGELTAIALAGSAERIPTLHDLLDLVAGRVPLLLELKTRRDRPVAPLCLAVRRELEPYRGPCAVMSFDPRISGWFARNAPDVVRGLVVSEGESRGLRGAAARQLSLWRARPDFLAYDVRDLPSRFAAAQRARGLPLLTWTVSSASLRQRAASHADAPIAEGGGLA